MDGKTLALLLALEAFSGLGCVKSPYHVERCDRPDPSGCVIEKVAIRGNHAVKSSQIEEKIATAETSHVLGGAVEHIPILSLWDRLTVEYERLDPFVLQRDLARIERYYRARGYYEAHVQAGRVVKRVDGKLRIEIAVDEGPPVRIARVTVDWKSGTPPIAPRATGGVQKVIDTLKKGAIFEEEPFEDAKGKIRRALTDRGYAYAEVEGKANVDLGRREASLAFTIDPGPRCTFGDITMAGQGDLPTVPLLAALQIRKGASYSTATIDSAEVALGDFGLFGSIDAEPKLSPAGEAKNPVIPVVFRVQPVLLRAVKLGIGGEIGGRVEVHGIVGWEHKNLFGGLRRFTIEASPAVAFFPRTFSTLFDKESVTPLPQFRLRATLTQPGVLLPFDARVRGFIRGSFNVYQLDTVAPENTDRIVGYLEGAGSIGLERTFYRSHINARVSFNFQGDVPFEYHLLKPRPLPDAYTTVLIPSVQATGSIDFRSSDQKRIDPVNPRRGVYFITDTQFAFGTATDFRLRPEIRGYVPVTSRVTLALRLAAGFLFPFNYGPAASVGKSGLALEQAQCRDSQLLPFRGFFSGGSSSNRGYPYNGVGPHQVLPATCLSTVRGKPTAVATGGYHLLESSVELRIPIVDKLGSAIFADASDVTREGLRLCAPHLSAGLGLRYDTPVGPLRADIGYRIPGAQVIRNATSCKRGLAEEGKQATVLGLPIAVSVALGEAF